MLPRPPRLDLPFPTDGTRAALAEWRDHQRLCAVAMLLEVVSLRGSPGHPRHPQSPSSVLLDEFRMEAERNLRPGHERPEAVEVALEAHGRIGGALQAYEERRGNLTVATMVMALVAGLLVHALFAAAVVIAAVEVGAMAGATALGMWASSSWMARQALRTRIARLAYP